MSNFTPGQRAVMITFFPMFIATLSLLTSIYNGYLNSRFLDVIQNNVGRVEYMRTCKEGLDSYFQLKFKAAELHQSGASATAEALADGRLAVAKFAALSTYLVNLRDESIRDPYTQFTRKLEDTITSAPALTDAQFKAAIASLDQTFTTLNNDCVTFSKTTPK
jgi:hypothetical protein